MAKRGAGALRTPNLQSTPSQPTTSSRPPPLPSSLVANIKPPQPINVHGDRVEEWTLFDQQFTWFSAATSLDSQPEPIQIAVFMSSIGAEAVKEFNSLKLSPADLASLTQIRTALKNRFAPKTNFRFERYQFNKLVQETGEAFDKFLTKVMARAKKCEFGDKLDDFVVDRIIFGIRDDQLRLKLLDIDPLTLTRSSTMCRNSETCQGQVKVVMADIQQKCQTTSTIESITKSPRTFADPSAQKSYNCRNCGTSHPWRQCPAFGQTCSRCGRKNHSVNVCRSRPENKTNSSSKPSADNRPSTVKAPQKKVSEIQDGSPNDDDASVCALSFDTSYQSLGETFYVNSIQLSVDQTQTNADDVWYEELCLPNKQIVRLKLDTGAQCNVLPKSVALKFRSLFTQSKVRRIISFSDGSFQIPVLGEVSIVARFQSRRTTAFNLTFLVVEAEVSPILGLKSCIECGFIRRICETKTIDWPDIKAEFASLFTGLGFVKNFEYDMVLVDQPKLPICPARRVPFQLHEAVKAELDFMEKLKDMKNVEVSMDDILVHARTDAELHELTRAVLTRIEKSGFKLNPQKCIFGATRVKFLGHVFSEDGLCPDSSKIEEPVLRYYDVNLPVVLSVDASSKAMGAVLLQQGQPVAYATKSLTDSQSYLPQIEKEALAVRFACQKFHQYIAGKELQIESDHKPLESIFRKPIYMAPPRLKRILLDVAPYNPTVVYKKGKDIPIPDMLSRDCENSIPQSEPELEVLVILPLSESATKSFQKATKNDPELKLLTETILKGWPEKQHQVPSLIQKFFNVRDELSVHDELVLKTDCIVVPTELRPRMLDLLHQGHLGATSCINRAKTALFWPGMTQAIVNFVARCEVCLSTAPQKQSEPLLLRPIPQRPWETVATDIFHLANKNYLLIADSYSGFVDFKHLSSLTSSAVITAMKYWFSVHGVPDFVDSDGGPQYSSSEFKNFADAWHFTHRVSSPHYPQSNGLAERNVATVKNLLTKCAKDKTDPYLALLNWRNTPRSKDIPSPNERLMSRRTKTLLPTPVSLLTPKVVSNVPEQLARARSTQKSYADRTALPQQPLQPGDVVFVREGNRQWVKARIVSSLPEPRSYQLETQTGQILRRNMKFLRRTSLPFVPEQQPPVPEQPPENRPVPEQIDRIQAPPVGAAIDRPRRIIRPPQRLNL